MEDLVPSPHQRADQVGREDVEKALRAAMGEGALTHGWIIAGPKGAGKATLAYRIARGVLDRAALSDTTSFTVPETAQSFKLIAAQGHPDLFVAERQWNEKTSKHQSEITIETIRKLTQFLNHTAALGGWRVAIIDAADDMNRNAANALLKALEEPPARTLLLLLSEAPGRLLATIRSRCRMARLRPIADEAVVGLLERENLARGEDALAIAAYAGGRPGYAIALAMGDGASAIALAEQFVGAVGARRSVAPVAQALAGKAGDDKWPIFQNVVFDLFSTAARKVATGAPAIGPLSGASAPALADVHDRLAGLAARGTALNLDRAQLVAAMGHDAREILSMR